MNNQTTSTVKKPVAKLPVPEKSYQWLVIGDETEPCLVNSIDELFETVFLDEEVEFVTPSHLKAQIERSFVNEKYSSKHGETLVFQAIGGPTINVKIEKNTRVTFS